MISFQESSLSVSNVLFACLPPLRLEPSSPTFITMARFTSLVLLAAAVLPFAFATQSEDQCADGEF